MQYILTYTFLINVVMTMWKFVEKIIFFQICGSAFCITFSFMTLTFCFTIMENIEEAIIESWRNDEKRYEITVEEIQKAYHCFSIMSSVLVLFVHHKLPAKQEVVISISSATYPFFISVFMYSSRKLILVATFLLAMGNSLLWIIQGNIVTETSYFNKTKHFAIYWIWYNLSCFMANIFLYINFPETTYMEFLYRMKVISYLTSIAVFSFFLLVVGMFLKKNKSEQIFHTPKSHKKQDWRIILICTIFLYMAIQQCYVRGIFTNLPCYKSNLRLREIDVISFTAIFIYGGEIIGGILQLSLSKVKSNILVTLGFFLTTLANLLTYFAAPSYARIIALVCKTIASHNHSTLATMIAFLFGVGNSLLNIQMRNILSRLYPCQSPAVYMILRLFMSTGTLVWLCYAPDLDVAEQCMIVQSFGCFVSFAYYLLDHYTKSNTSIFRDAGLDLEACGSKN